MAAAIEKLGETISEVPPLALERPRPDSAEVEPSTALGAQLDPPEELGAGGGAGHPAAAGSEGIQIGRDLMQLSFAVAGGLVVYGLWQCSRGKRLLLPKRRGADTVRRRPAP